MSRFLFFYLTLDESDAIHALVPAHVDYWKSKNLPDYLGGPFADWSGGLITFSATSLEDAQHTVRQDPFVRERVIEQSWVKEWWIE